eukprot:CAMPEP_0114653126 /NCGR_PEP_ID=MMETSP0191-20121206/9538_1 /TAXON_ID=126664 /ORGANISM="Sorites sp." /LENGTH=60 /DNA_ID=CAMNT_0001868041 /DNA_START=13 /DNA_END=196 /DNA_ORIENTATION=-
MNRSSASLLLVAGLLLAEVLDIFGHKRTWGRPILAEVAGGTGLEVASGVLALSTAEIGQD